MHLSVKNTHNPSRIFTFSKSIEVLIYVQHEPEILNLLRVGLIVIFVGIVLFVSSLTIGLLTIVPDPPAPAPELPEHMTPITPQVGKSHPVFGILNQIGIGLFGAGIVISIAGLVGRQRK